MKVVRNDIVNNLYLHDKLPILHFSPSGSLQSWPYSQIWWFFKFDTVISNDTVRSVLFEMNDVNNVIYNNFEYDDQLPKMHRFLSRSL